MFLNKHVRGMFFIGDIPLESLSCSVLAAVPLPSGASLPAAARLGPCFLAPISSLCLAVQTFLFWKISLYYSFDNFLPSIISPWNCYLSDLWLFSYLYSMIFYVLFPRKCPQILSLHSSMIFNVYFSMFLSPNFFSFVLPFFLNTTPCFMSEKILNFQRL